MHQNIDRLCIKGYTDYNVAYARPLRLHELTEFGLELYGINCRLVSREW